MSRISVINDPEAFQQFCELYSAGASRLALADEFGVDKRTITRWLGRKDVQAELTQLRQRRINRITRSIDAKINAAIEDGAVDGDVELMLKIRKEYVPQQIEVGGVGSAEEAAIALWDRLDKGGDVAEIVEGSAEEIDDESSDG